MLFQPPPLVKVSLPGETEEEGTATDEKLARETWREKEEEEEEEDRRSLAVFANVGRRKKKRERRGGGEGTTRFVVKPTFLFA